MPICKPLLAAFAAISMTFASVAVAQLKVLGNQQIHARHSTGNFGFAISLADIDEDGLIDIVVGNPLLDIPIIFDHPDAGEVAILFNEGGRFNPEPLFWDFYRQGPGTTPLNWGGTVQEDDLFGHAVATGYFDLGDRVDVVVGTPGDKFFDTSAGVDVATGSYTVAYGMEGPDFGLTRTQFQTAPNISGGGLMGNGAEGERFGWALAVGDFNGDDYDDVAIGVPGETLNGSANGTGGVNVVYGALGGLGGGTPDEQFITQATSFVVGAAEAGDEFGDALVAGNFNCDEYDDLVAGIHREHIGNVSDAGAAVVMYGGPSGLGNEVLGSASFHQGRDDVIGGAEPGDRMGSSLASGDFDGDGCDDLAVGIPFEDVGAVNAAGAVAVFYGSSDAGLTADGDQFIDGSWSGGIEATDLFGATLFAGDFNGDGRDDLAIGVIREELTGGPINAGAVSIVYGSVGGLVAADSEFWHEAINGMVSDPAENGEFGAALAAADFNGDGKADLAIGVPRNLSDIGSLQLLYTAGAVEDRVAFVTSVTGTGDLSTWPDANGMEGVDAGDEICFQRASAAGLANPEQFVAWLSTVEDDAFCRAQGRLGLRSVNCGLGTPPNESGPWLRTDGVPFGADIVTLLIGPDVVYTPLHLDEFGNSVGFTASVMTGTGVNGRLLGDNCDDWSSTAGSSNRGETGATSGSWTSIGTIGCGSTSARLYCLQAGPGTPTDLVVSSRRRGFVTQSPGSGDLASWPLADPGTSGIEAGDSICNNQAAQNGLPDPGTYKAWLSDSSVDARDRFVNDGPWHRNDGFRIADDLADLTDSLLMVPNNVAGNSSYLTNVGTWTGTQPDGTASGSHCSDWDSTAGNGSGGRANRVPGNWTDLEDVACSSVNRYLYCFSDAVVPLVKHGFESGDG